MEADGGRGCCGLGDTVNKGLEVKLRLPWGEQSERQRIPFSELGDLTLEGKVGPGDWSSNRQSLEGGERGPSCHHFSPLIFPQLAESDFASTFRLLTVFAYGTYADYLGNFWRGWSSGDWRWEKGSLQRDLEDIPGVPDLDPLDTQGQSQYLNWHGKLKKKKKKNEGG